MHCDRILTHCGRCTAIVRRGTAANALRLHPDALQPPAVTTPAADPSRDDVTRPPAAGGARLAHLASRVELRHAHASRRGRKRPSRDSDIRTGAPSASAPRRSGGRTQKARPSSRAVEDLAVEDRARTAPGRRGPPGAIGKVADVPSGRIEAEERQRATGERPCSAHARPVRLLAAGGRG
jgi:hypothetical protein